MDFYFWHSSFLFSLLLVLFFSMFCSVEFSNGTELNELYSTLYTTPLPQPASYPAIVNQPASKLTIWCRKKIKLKENLKSFENMLLRIILMENWFYCHLMSTLVVRLLTNNLLLALWLFTQIELNVTTKCILYCFYLFVIELLVLTFLDFFYIKTECEYWTRQHINTCCLIFFVWYIKFSSWNMIFW